MNLMNVMNVMRIEVPTMRAEYINPFLESARSVIEQVINIRPTTGQLGIKDVKWIDNYIWIQIGITGQMNGDIRSS